MHRIKTVLANALGTYALIYIGHTFWGLGAELINHFRKHPAQQN